ELPQQPDGVAVFRRNHRIKQIREHHRQSPFGMTGDEELKGLLVVDVTQLRLDAVKRLQELGVLGLTLARRQVAMDGVRENQKAQVVLERLADVSEHENGVDGVVE